LFDTAKTIFTMLFSSFFALP